MKRCSKLLSALLAVCLLLSTVPLALADEADVPSPWAEDAIKFAISWQGLVPSELQCQYQKDTTRAEFAKMAIHYLCMRYEYPTYSGSDVSDESTVKDFVFYILEQSQADGLPRYQQVDSLPRYQKDAFLNDVPAEQRAEVEQGGWRELLKTMTPFAESSDPDKADDFFFIHAAYVLGIVKGRDDGTFGPDDPITRQEAAVMLDRVYQVYAVELLDEAELDKYMDQDEIGTWAKTSVARMVQHEVMTGTGAGTFSPHSYYTREQCIVTYERLLFDPPMKSDRYSAPYLTHMDEKLADVYRWIKVKDRWDTDDAVVMTGTSHMAMMHGGYLYSTHLFILYRSDSKENVHIIKSGDRPDDFSLSDDQQYVYYQSSFPYGDLEDLTHFRIHINTGEIEELP